MLRTVLSGIAIVGGITFAAIAPAEAATTTPYPAPPVTSSTTAPPPTPTTVNVLPTSRSLTSGPTAPAPTSATATSVGGTANSGTSNSTTSASTVPSNGQTPATPTTMAVLGTSQSSPGPLASTGSGINVGLVAGTGLAVVLAGAGLILLGSRRARGSRVRGH